ncbi:MAG: hypothetical protein ABSB74_17520 [Tepidisphaeraceae bacterium]
MADAAIPPGRSPLYAAKGPGGNIQTRNIGGASCSTAPLNLNGPVKRLNERLDDPLRLLPRLPGQLWIDRSSSDNLLAAPVGQIADGGGDIKLKLRVGRQARGQATSDLVIVGENHHGSRQYFFAVHDVTDANRDRGDNKWRIGQIIGRNELLLKHAE